MEKITRKEPIISKKRMYEFTPDDIKAVRQNLLRDPNVISIEIPDQYEDLKQRVLDFNFKGSFGEDSGIVRIAALALLNYLLAPTIYDMFVNQRSRRVWEKKLFRNFVELPELYRFITSNKLSSGEMFVNVVGQILAFGHMDAELRSEREDEIIAFPAELIEKAKQLSVLIKSRRDLSDPQEEDEGKDTKLIMVTPAPYEKYSLEEKVEVANRVEALALAAIEHILSSREIKKDA